MFMKNKLSTAIAALITTMTLSANSAAQAGPFTSCPSEAFLAQNTVAELYGVQLATGYYSRLAYDMGTRSKINAIGFNFHDDYLYGWTYENRTVGRIDSDYQVTPLSVSNMPNSDFFVGDVALSHNTYYVYRSGSALGLYAISLDPQDPNYLAGVRVIDGDSVKLRIFDMAFHPTNDFAYSVDAGGMLHRFSPYTGASEQLGNTGATGTFGAVYFDVDENLYISRNSDGYVFRIKVGAGETTAELFAYGPSSSNNDGARCALAPVISVDAPTIDFGDAPNSYGTNAADNGARHDTSAGIVYMGAGVDPEADAYIYPLSDDEFDTRPSYDPINGADPVDDEDGVSFVTGLELGATAMVTVESSAYAYLNAWVDFNNDGDFDADEIIAEAVALSPGNNVVSYSVPAWAEVGNSWARFRLSSTETVGPIGGTSDGEVEDYQVDIADPGTTATYYPQQNDWATIAFEDNWPIVGDYDFTDLVVNYRLTQYVRDNHVVRVKIEGQIAAVGASYHNGFAFRFPGVLRDSIDESDLRYIINDSVQSESALEAGRTEAIVIVANDVWDYVSAGESCKYYRTEAGCGSAIQMRFSMLVPMSTPVPVADMPAAPFDPFLFASEGGEHGYVFGQAPGRAYEIHLKNQEPTEAFRADFFNRGDDASNAAQGDFFVNANGMPWAINVGTEWKYPLEYMDVIYAYPYFANFATTEGAEHADWYIESKAILKNTFSD
jgi:LruC domain-containing protein